MRELPLTNDSDSLNQSDYFSYEFECEAWEGVVKQKDTQREDGSKGQETAEVMS